MDNGQEKDWKSAYYQLMEEKYALKDEIYKIKEEKNALNEKYLQTLHELEMLKQSSGSVFNEPVTDKVGGRIRRPMVNNFERKAAGGTNMGLRPVGRFAVDNNVDNNREEGSSNDEDNGMMQRGCRVRRPPLRRESISSIEQDFDSKTEIELSQENGDGQMKRDIHEIVPRKNPVSANGRVRRPPNR